RLPLQQTGMSPHEFIYEKHNIDSIQFEKSNSFYSADFNTYERIHLRVKDFLDNKKIEIDTLIAREKRRQDSIKFTVDSIKPDSILIQPNDAAVLKMVKPVSSDSLN